MLLHVVDWLKASASSVQFALITHIVEYCNQCNTLHLHIIRVAVLVFMNLMKQAVRNGMVYIIQVQTKFFNFVQSVLF